MTQTLFFLTFMFAGLNNISPNFTRQDPFSLRTIMSLKSLHSLTGNAFLSVLFMLGERVPRVFLRSPTMFHTSLVLIFFGLQGCRLRSLFASLRSFMSVEVLKHWETHEDSQWNSTQER